MHNFLHEAAHRQNDRHTNRPDRITPPLAEVRNKETQETENKTSHAS